MLVRSRARGQSVVEFGVIALLFTLLIFAVIDFGLLLNTWLAVSSGARDIGRQAAVGHQQRFLLSQANALNVPSVQVTGTKCCSATSAVEVDVEYFGCQPWVGGCTPMPATQINPLYPAGTLDNVGQSTSCPPPSNPPPAPNPNCRPLAGDFVRITIVAHGAEVITPLVRPFFGCDGSQPQCYVPLSSTVLGRFEGLEY